MTHYLLFAILSLSVYGVLKLLRKKKHEIKTHTLVSLFLFGMLLSIPFVLIEYLAFSLKYYLVILAFIAIELLIVTLEHKWEYLHHLMHHNIRELRLLSFFVVSLGFTYSELSFYILKSPETAGEILMSLPFKAVFAVFIHTVLTSSAAILTATESIVEHFFMFILYYLRLIFISVSHYLYALFMDHNTLHYLLIPLLFYNLYLLFKHKRYLDRKGELLA